MAGEDSTAWPVDGIKVYKSMVWVGRMVEELLPPQPRQDYLELLEAGEEQLALDHVASWLAEDEAPIPAELREEMLALAEVFGMTETITRLLSFCPAS